MKKLFILILCILTFGLVGSIVAGGGTMMMTGGSAMVVEDETGYSDYRISLADGQSWFGGDVLGADLFDAGAGVFTSGTYSWVAYGSNTIANDSNTLKITYVDNSTGARLYLKDSSDLSADLVVGQLYKFQYDAKVGSGDSVDIKIHDGASISTIETITNTEFQTFKHYFVVDTDESVVRTWQINMGAGEILWLDNITIQAVTSPADYASTGALVKVCDSGGTDAANCATGYMGEAGSGETLGSELVTNGDMELDSNWANHNTPTTQERSNTQVFGDSWSRKYTVDAAWEGIKSDTFTVTALKEYIRSGFIYPDDATKVGWLMESGDGTTDDSGQGLTGNLTGLNQDAWNQITQYGVSGVSGAGALIKMSSGAAATGSWYADNVSIKEVTEPNPNSVMIYKEPHLATEGWLTIGGSFDPNDISTFEIYQ